MESLSSEASRPVMERFFLVVAALVTALAAPARIHADDGSLAVQILDALNKAYGVHPGFRANHAKGIVAKGSFEPSGEAAKLSRSPLFAGGTLPITVRFSDASGIPTVPDGAPAANPHGMAIKFHLPSGADTDMVTNSLKVFPVATGEEFRDLNLAIAASPPGSPKPTALDTFVASHPSVPKALGSVSTPASFADEVYYGIDAFVFTNAAAKEQPVRYVITPDRIIHLTPEEAAKQPPDFLVDELPARLAKGPVSEGSARGTRRSDQRSYPGVARRSASGRARLDHGREGGTRQRRGAEETPLPPYALDRWDQALRRSPHCAAQHGVLVVVLAAQLGSVSAGAIPSEETQGLRAIGQRSGSCQ